MKNETWNIILIVIFVSNLLLITPNYSKTRPIWLKELPKGKYYYYFSGVGSSSSIDEAKNIAIGNALSQNAFKEKLKIIGTLTTIKSEQINQSKNGIDYELREKARQELILKSESSTIKGLNIEEEYWDEEKTSAGIKYNFWILMKLPKTNNIPAQELTYGITPICKSAIVPGWGQFHKGETQKGLLFLVGEGLLVSSIFVSDYLYRDYNQKAWDTKSDIELSNEYNSLSGQWKTVRTFSVVGAAVIYIFNIVDVVSTKGAKIYASDSSYPHFALNSGSEIGGITLALAIKF